MAKQPDPAEELARRREEIAALHPGIERREDHVGPRQRGARPRMGADAAAEA